MANNQFKDEDFDQLGAIPDSDFDALGAVDDQQSSLQDRISAANEQDQVLQEAVANKEAEAALAGLAQGTTFGFSDELGATKDVVSDFFVKNPTAKKWREYQKEREALNKALSEESPMAYMGGELTGAVASGVLMPGLGTAKIAATGAKIAPGLGKFLAGQSGNLATRVAGKGAAGAIEAAPIGALYGVGASESDLSKPDELIKDAASGATMGLLTGGALSSIGQTGKESLKYAKEFVDDTDFLRQVQKAYEYGTKRLNLGSSKTMNKLSLVPGQRAEDLVNNIFEIDAALGKEVGSAIDNAQQMGTRINVDNTIVNTANKIYQNLFVENPTLSQILDPKSAKLLKTVAQREVGDLTPIEARALKDELYSLSDKLAGLNSDQARLAKDVGLQLAGSLDNALKTSIPDYKIAANNFREFRELVPETIISKGTPSAYDKVYVGDLKNPELKLFESAKEMLKQAQLPGESAAPERATFEQLRRNLLELQRKNPKALPKAPEEVYKQLRSQADELAMIRQAQGFDPQEGPKGVFSGAVSGLVTTGRGLSISAANKTGIAAKSMSSVFKAGDEKLLGLANQLKSKKGMEYVGESLEKAIQNKDVTAKNALLFKLMQMPEYREALRDEGETNE